MKHLDFTLSRYFYSIKYLQNKYPATLASFLRPTGLEHHISESRARAKAEQLDLRHRSRSQSLVTSVGMMLMYDVSCRVMSCQYFATSRFFFCFIVWLFPAMITGGSKAHVAGVVFFGTGADPLVLKQKAAILGGFAAFALVSSF